MPFSKKKVRMIEFILQASFAYVVFVIAMYCMQDRFIYFPQKDMLEPADFGHPEFEPIGAITRDNEKLLLWWKPPLPNYPLVIYFHGNAGHLGMRAAKLSALAKKGFGVLAVSWRGYGASTGMPSENGLYEDARATLELAVRHFDINYDRIILYGESLGTGVAVHFGSLTDFGMIVLEAPYLSVTKRAEEKFPYVPVRYILRSKFDSISKIGKVASPLLVLHGELDTVIPPRHGKELLEAAPGHKKGLFLPEIAHSDFPVGWIADTVMAYAHETGMLADVKPPQSPL